MASSIEWLEPPPHDPPHNVVGWEGARKHDRAILWKIMMYRQTLYFITSLGNTHHMVQVHGFWRCSVDEHVHQHWSRCVHGVHEHMFTTIGLVHVHELNIRNCHEQAVNIYKSNNLAISQFFTIFSFFSALLTPISCNKVVRDLLLHFQSESQKNIKKI